MYYCTFIVVLLLLYNCCTIIHNQTFNVFKPYYQCLDTSLKTCLVLVWALNSLSIHNFLHSRKKVLPCQLIHSLIQRQRPTTRVNFTNLILIFANVKAFSEFTKVTILLKPILALNFHHFIKVAERSKRQKSFLKFSVQNQFTKYCSNRNNFAQKLHEKCCSNWLQTKWVGKVGLPIREQSKHNFTFLFNMFKLWLFEWAETKTSFKELKQENNPIKLKMP